MAPIQPIPLVQAYVHGDCDQARPLLDALDHGFCNVEADVWFCDGELLVAHDLCDVVAGRSLKSVYLEPLFARVEQGGGWVFEAGIEFVLLVDIKNEPEETYRALRVVLEPYSFALSSFSAGKGVAQRAVKILLSGERPIETVAGESERDIFIDGRAPDLNGTIDPELMPWVSDDWEKLFEWNGDGPLSKAESLRLASMVKSAHSNGAKLRLWSAPDEPIGWEILLSHGVDLLSTDRIGALREFLLRRVQLSGNASLPR